MEKLSGDLENLSQNVSEDEMSKAILRLCLQKSHAVDAEGPIGDLVKDSATASAHKFARQPAPRYFSSDCHAHASVCGFDQISRRKEFPTFFP